MLETVHAVQNVPVKASAPGCGRKEPERFEGIKRNRRVDTRSYRNELKFLCTEQDLYLIENKIRHVCRLDANAGAGGTYSVKSLYFDTHDDRCYYENLAGVDDRKKYRIRIYNDDTDIIKLECKYSLHGRKTKESCNITRQQCEILTKRGGLQPFSVYRNDMEKGGGGKQQLLSRFLLERNLYLLTPKIIVDYRRTPYVYPAGNVRITFDRAIRSSLPAEGFPAGNTALRSILPENVHILEVKYDDLIPAAILELAAAGRPLRRTSFSKYALCREYSPG